MPRYSTLYARIKVDGGELPEYDIQVDESEKQVSCWIPSEAGKKFSVCWNNASPVSDAGGWVTLDGVNVGGCLCYTGSSRELVHSSWSTSSTTGRYFSFSPISYTDDDAYLHVSVANLGVIKIDIWSVLVGGERQFCCPTIDSDVKVHERSKKLGVHRVQFGEEEMTQYKVIHDTKPVCRLATFIFKYRPLDILQANGILPLAPLSHDISSQQVRENKKRKLPEGDVIEVKDDDEDLGRRVKKLKKELQQLEARQAKEGKVKVERQNRLSPTNEVIDLT
ncbi:hypothetical protein APHAL10511_007640 [Amanita phalloides]|nr:hypothetical protein APHAL10511_007640 [Amanita phalloides]